MCDAERLSKLHPVTADHVQFRVYGDEKKGFRVDIPCRLDNNDTIHTRLRVFSSLNGQPIDFALFCSDTYLGHSIDQVLDVGKLEHSIIKAAVSSNFSKSYSHYGVNLNHIAELNVRPMTTKDNDKYNRDDAIVVAEMMMRSQN